MPMTIQDVVPQAPQPLNQVQERPKVIRTREIAPPKPANDVKPIFGSSRETLQSESSNVTIKAGNTLSKEEDQEILPPGDQSLPVPVDEYLVTSMPKLRREMQIPYPPGAKVRSVQGPVVMNLLIGADGKVKEVTLVEGSDDELNRAALEAVRQMEFDPAVIGDKPAPVRIRYTYRFVLEK